MRDQIISFETAKLAKEKGFNWDSNSYYNNTKDLIELLYYHVDRNYNDYSGYPEDVLLFTPTQSLLQRWLREEHKIWVQVVFDPYVHYYYAEIILWNQPVIKVMNYEINEHPVAEFDSWEDALETGLLAGLQLIKK